MDGGDLLVIVTSILLCLCPSEGHFSVGERRNALTSLEEAISQSRHICGTSGSERTLGLPQVFPDAHRLAEVLGNGRFWTQMDTAVRTANLMNTFLNVVSADYDVPAASEPFLPSVSRSVVEGDPVVYGCAIVFRHLVFAPYAVRISEKVSMKDLVVDGDDQGFWRMAFTQFEGMMNQSVGELPSVVVGDSDETGNGSVALPSNFSATDSTVATTTTTAMKVSPHVLRRTRAEDCKWSTPWFDCGKRSLAITFSAPFFAQRGWRGLVMINVALDDIDINQCSDANDFFAGTHLCHEESMQCEHHAGLGFRRGSYRCSCRRGFFWPNSSEWASELELVFDNISSDFRCQACSPGCEDCAEGSPCFVDYDFLLRGVPLGLQSFCMTITAVLAVAVFRMRKCKAMATAMWTLLEMVLLGAFLLYVTVVIRYFEPNTITCILEPWFRELGFAICYGAIILKIYRILVEFRTRKAHRWVVRDKDLLKYLLAITLVVVGYMCAWTAINVDHIGKGDDMVHVGVTSQQLKYYICRSQWWDYVTESGEILFLVFGLYLGYHVRNASSDFKEKRFLCLSVLVEAVVSTSLYVARYVLWDELHPDYMFLLYFGRCHLTVSLVLILLFTPKLWYHHKPPQHLSTSGDHRGQTEGAEQGTASETMKLHDGVTSNGEVDIGDINLADMDPEDIRTELRRVYTQLQVLRNKTMRKDNPHISKRRGGRKATHRRFSLQAFQRHKHHHDLEPEAEVSKTPEESTASIEHVHGGPTGVNPSSTGPTCATICAPAFDITDVDADVQS